MEQEDRLYFRIRDAERFSEKLEKRRFEKLLEQLKEQTTTIQESVFTYTPIDYILTDYRKLRVRYVPEGIKLIWE